MVTFDQIVLGLCLSWVEPRMSHLELIVLRLVDTVFLGGLRFRGSD
jgi:hypothetical protein